MKSTKRDNIIHGVFREKTALGERPNLQKIKKVPIPPKYLQPIAKRLWKILAKELIEKGVLTNLDLVAFEILCDSYASFRETRVSVFTNEKGKPRTLAQYMKGRNSQTALQLNVMRQCWRNFKSLLREFGITSSDWKRLSIQLPDEEEIRETDHADAIPGYK